MTPPDADSDGVDDAVDACLDTAIPESVPTKRLGVNRWALVDDDVVFDTTPPPGGGGGPDFMFTVADTGGCSCEQIIDAWDLGQGHTKFGCSSGVMLQWIALMGGFTQGSPEATAGQTGAGHIDALSGGAGQSSSNAQDTPVDSRPEGPSRVPQRRTPDPRGDR